MSEFKTEKCEDSKKEDKQESKQESKQEGKKEEGREDKNLKSRGLEEILIRLRETACCHVSARKRTY